MSIAPVVLSLDYLNRLTKLSAFDADFRIVAQRINEETSFSHYKRAQFL